MLKLQKNWGNKNPTIFNIIRWVDCLIDQAFDGPSIILIVWKQGRRKVWKPGGASIIWWP